MAPDARSGATRPRPLRGIRVVDLGGPFGAYAARLLADLGADVTRVVPASGDPLAAEWPLVETAAGHESAFAWFVNLDKEVVALDLDDAADRGRLDRLLAEADVLIESWGNDSQAWGWRERSDLAAQHPRLTVVSITPFGITGPRSDDAATDLIALAAGGLLSLGGYPDGPPIAVHGQAHLAASIFGAAAAIFGLIAREDDGRGRRLDVAAQEVIAAALEDAIPQYDLIGTVRRRAGDTPREAGTGIYRCADGYVSMVAGRLGTAKAWRALVAWLGEWGAEEAEVLREEAWDSFSHRQRPESIRTFADIFERFTARHTKEQLYEEAQRRDIALSPVNEIPDVLADAQLAARHFFQPLEVPDVEREVVTPGRPYRLSEEAEFRPHLAQSRATAGVVAEDGKPARQAAEQAALSGAPARP
jgi:benzylsuccinate CoA-transferase BbsE subunit